MTKPADRSKIGGLADVPGRAAVQRGVLDRVPRTARFVVVGAGAAAVHLVVAAIGVELLALPALAANAVGFIVAFGVSYLGQRNWTFDSQRAHAAAVPRFLIVAGVGALVNQTGVWALLHFTRLHYLAAIAVALIVAAIVTYQLNRRWTFRARGPAVVDRSVR